MTVAELGLRIQSGDATVASRNLEAMTQAGGRAEQQFRTLEATARRSMMTVGQTVNGPLKAVNDNLRAISGAGSGGRGPFDVILAGLTALPIPASAAAVAFGAVTTAAGYLISRITGELPSADSALDNHAELIGRVRDAYKNAADKAGEFLEQSKAVTRFDLERSVRRKEYDLANSARGIVSGLSTPRSGGLSDMGGVPDVPMAMVGQIDANSNVKAFTDTISELNRELNSGANPNIQKFQDGLVSIADAARATNPALANQAEAVLNLSRAKSAGGKSAQDHYFELQKELAALAQLNGTATEHQKKLLGIRDAKVASTRATTESRDAYDRMLETIQKRNEKAEIELATLGMTAGAAAAYRVEQELLNAAKRAELELTPQQIENNKALAESAGQVAEKLEMARGPLGSYIRESTNLNKGLQTVAVDGLRGVENALVDITKGTSTASEAFKKMTASILEDLGRMLIRAAMARAMGLFLGGGGVGGGAPAIGMVGAAGGMAVPTFFHRGGLVGRDGEQRGAYAFPAKVPRLHSGANLKSDEVFAVLQKGEQVIPKGGAGGGVVLNFAPNIDARGADAAAVARIEATQRRMAADFKSSVVSAVRDARSARML